MSTVRDLQPSSAALENATAEKFPAAQYALASAYLDTYANEIAQAAKSADGAALDRAAEILLEAYSGGRRVFSCGNGGSAAIANHLQCDHTKNVRASTDLAPRVQSLCANVELLTAIANDIAYDNIFAYQLQSLSEPGDVLIAVTSSGRSPNIVCALAWARDNGLKTIALTGFSGGDARKLADVTIHVEAANYGIVEDLHQAIMHALAQFIRQSRMTAEAITSNVF
jgi:D-sedoheptulose 7-phosphate isomerase/D-glycero-D-manno-heptose 1,7-bisphosphate phosphatase